MGCHAACRTAQLGVLYRTMVKTGLMTWAPEVRASLSASPPPRLADILRTLKVIEFPDWYAASGLLPHRCMVPELTTSPGMSATTATTTTPRAPSRYRPFYFALPTSQSGSSSAPPTASERLAHLDRMNMGMDMRTATTTRTASTSNSSDGMRAISTRIAALVADVNRIILEETQTDFAMEFFERRRGLV